MDYKLLPHSLFVILLFLLCLVPGALIAKVPKDTADYYFVHADKYLGKNVTLWIEDTNLIGELNSLQLVEFRSITWSGINAYGTAKILVDKNESARFLKKYSTNNYQQTSVVGTKSKKGWVGQRLRCRLLRDPSGKLVYYTGKGNPFRDPDKPLVLYDLEGRSLKCTIVKIYSDKVLVKRTIDQRRLEIPLAKLDGSSQRLVRDAR